MIQLVNNTNVTICVWKFTLLLICLFIVILVVNKVHWMIVASQYKHKLLSRGAAMLITVSAASATSTYSRVVECCSRWRYSVNFKLTLVLNIASRCTLWLSNKVKANFCWDIYLARWRTAQMFACLFIHSAPVKHLPDIAELLLVWLGAQMCFVLVCCILYVAYCFLSALLLRVFKNGSVKRGISFILFLFSPLMALIVVTALVLVRLVLYFKGSHDTFWQCVDPLFDQEVAFILLVYGVLGYWLEFYNAASFGLGSKGFIFILYMQFAVLLLIVLYIGWDTILLSLPLLAHHFMPVDDPCDDPGGSGANSTGPSSSSNSSGGSFSSDSATSSGSSTSSDWGSDDESERARREHNARVSGWDQNTNSSQPAPSQPNPSQPNPSQPAPLQKPPGSPSEAVAQQVNGWYLDPLTALYVGTKNSYGHNVGMLFTATATLPYLALLGLSVYGTIVRVNNFVHTPVQSYSINRYEWLSRSINSFKLRLRPYALPVGTTALQLRSQTGLFSLWDFYRWKVNRFPSPAMRHFALTKAVSGACIIIFTMFSVLGKA